MGEKKKKDGKDGETISNSPRSCTYRTQDSGGVDVTSNEGILGLVDSRVTWELLRGTCSHCQCCHLKWTGRSFLASPYVLSSHLLPDPTRGRI